ncbi:PQQ-binding-like beta-propeller repeat protein [Rhodococcus sp. G-MC3]|uniref:PQQ-binding-like beta-propeller repeat protein n=1 Tax=Rhodococcus sp. G-MC3 TaxID=3046209 RepID=UPI0024B99184|nr:PQQ-binding-like beta-propeller repeat protein [Rhodococcus sp. G-MC3]MDJ0396128.1 PQQ-binding-like beta-propeller repeat protein [Rhodococcus sp. G-MC3]
MNTTLIGDGHDRPARRTDKSRTTLAVVVATVAVAAAVVAVTRVDVEPDPTVPGDDWTAAYSDPTPTTTQEPHGPIHMSGWSVDAQSAYGREFAAFRSPAAGLMFDSGAYGVIDGGDVLISAVGLPNPRTYSLDSPKLVGLDEGDGEVRWSVSPGGIDSCASRPVLGEVVCLDSYADVPALVAIDIEDGSVRRIPLPDGWFPFGIESDGDSVYVLEGNPEDGESVLHGGPVNALADAWSLPVPAFAPWEGVDGTLIHIDDDLGLVTLGGDAQFFDTRTGSAIADLELISETSVVDTESGEEVLQLIDPYATELTVGDTHFSQSEDSVTATDTETGDITWTWPLPTTTDGFTGSGTIIEATSGVYFLNSESIVQLEPDGN